MGVSSALQGTAVCRGITVLLSYCCTESDKSGALSVAHSERVHGVNVFRIGRNILSFATKLCACISLAFLAEVVS